MVLILSKKVMKKCKNDREKIRNILNYLKERMKQVSVISETYLKASFQKPKHF